MMRVYVQFKSIEASSLVLPCMTGDVMYSRESHIPLLATQLSL